MTDHSDPPPLQHCHRCGGALVPVAYGYPGIEMLEAAERGEILLGGCIVDDGQPTSRCPACLPVVDRRVRG